MQEARGAGASSSSSAGSTFRGGDPSPTTMSDMLAKVAAYVEGEAQMSVEDYRLLQAMNVRAAERYNGMADYASGLVAFAQRLQTKCDDILPQLDQVRAAPIGESGTAAACAARRS